MEHTVHLIRAFLYLLVANGLAWLAMTRIRGTIKGELLVHIIASLMFLALGMAAVSRLYKLDEIFSIYCLTPMALVLAGVLWATIYANRKDG